MSISSDILTRIERLHRLTDELDELVTQLDDKGGSSTVPLVNSLDAAQQLLYKARDAFLPLKPKLKETLL